MKCSELLEYAEIDCGDDWNRTVSMEFDCVAERRPQNPLFDGMTTDDLNAERKKASFRLRHRLFFGNMPGRPKGFKSDHEAILSYALRTQEKK